MSFRSQSGQPEVELTAGSSLSSAATSSAEAGSARGGLSAVPEQHSGDLSIRQDRVDALRAQIEAGTYMVNPHAVANAMFQNHFGAEDEFVRDPGSCPIDQLPRSECLALGRCECNRGLRAEARPLAG